MRETVSDMKPKIVKANSLSELQTYERCSIAENYSSDAVSIARARVKPGVATVAHHLNGVEEIYLIANGKGKVNVDGLQPVEVAEGDVVVIPAGTSQRITNTGKTDLVFYCICTPKFTTDCYCDEEAQKSHHKN
jgi:mannose-6-phosphate isomerase-like protein (cupin superfamily)